MLNSTIRNDHSRLVSLPGSHNLLELATALAELPVAIALLHGPECVCTFANHSFYQLFSRREDETIGKKAVEIFSASEYKAVLASIGRMNAAGQATGEVEFSMTDTNAPALNQTFHLTAFRPEEAAQNTIGIVFSDITQWKLAEKTLAEIISERKDAELALKQALDATERQKRLYEAVSNNTPDLVYVFDLQYRFTYANKALLSMWGLTWEQSIGKGLRENGYEEWHAQMHEQEIDIVVETRKTIRGTVSFPHAEFGRRIYDYIFSPVINEKGEVEAIAGTTRDITELNIAVTAAEESERNLRNTILQAPVAICIFKGPDYVVEIANDRMLQLWNRPKEEVLGRSIFIGVPEVRDQGFKELMDKVYYSGESFSANGIPVSLQRGEGVETIYINLQYEAFREGDGTISGVVAVANDVTEQVSSRKKIEDSEARYKTLSESLEKLIRERTKELQRSNDDLQQFAHVASHDLKEPVRKVKIFANRLEQQLTGKLDDSSMRFIEKIHSAANRMYTMIEGVLAYSTTNATIQQPESVDLNKVIEHIKTDLEIVLVKTSADIRYSSLPTLEGAPVLIYQLFYNLINNSIKFAQAGVFPRITITAETSLVEKEEFVNIVLQDNGIGFEQEEASRIFETFSRLNPKDQYEGTGLGLSLCKKIVERHGGSITANGVPDGGARFNITLPLKQHQQPI
jgi:PAS domain S-box-containing protein